LQPALEIGAEPADAQRPFVRVTVALPRSDGGYVIGDGGAGALYLFNSAGQFVRQLARRGTGPGELQALSQVIVQSGDTTVVWDATLRRLTRYAPDGALVGAEPLDVGSLAALVQPPYFLSSVTLLGGSGYLLRLSEQPSKLAAGKVAKGAKAVAQPSSGRQRARALFMRSPIDRSRADTLVDLRDLEFQVVPWPGAGQQRLEPYLARRPLIAAARLTGALCAGDQSAAEITCMDASMQRRLLVRWSSQSIPVDQAAVRTWRDSLATVYSRKIPRDEAYRLVDAMGLPSEQPPYTELLLDEKDRLWVRIADAAGDNGRGTFVVFDLDGALLAEVEVPLHRILHIDGTRIIGVFVDADGFESVRVLHYQEVETSH
jgi:hypothetical protein